MAYSTELIRNNKPVKLTKQQQRELLEVSKKQRNLAELQHLVQKLMVSLDELAYKIERTKSREKKDKLEKKFDKRLSLVISLQQGHFSIETH